jgi:hypothetical protein
MATVVHWIFTEAQCGKSFLDAHFAYVNIQLHRAIVGGTNYPDAIGLFNALCYDGGIRACTVLLVNELSTHNMVKSACTHIHNAGLVSQEPRQTHDIIFEKRNVHVRRQTNLDDGMRTIPSDVWTTTLPRIGETEDRKSSIDSRPIQTRVRKQPTTAPSAEDLANEPVRTLEVAIQQATTTVMIGMAETAAVVPGLVLPPGHNEKDDLPLNIHWARKSNRTGMTVRAPVKKILHRMYDIGVEDKSRKYTKEKAYAELHEGVLRRSWDQRAIMTAGSIASVWSTYADDLKKKIRKDATEAAAAREREQAAAAFRAGGILQPEVAAPAVPGDMAVPDVTGASQSDTASATVNEDEQAQLVEDAAIADSQTEGHLEDLLPPDDIQDIDGDADAHNEDSD